MKKVNLFLLMVAFFSFVAISQVSAQKDQGATTVKKDAGDINGVRYKWYKWGQPQFRIF